MAKVYKIWTYIEEIDEDEDHYEDIDLPKGVYEVFDTIEEARAYQDTILGHGMYDNLLEEDETPEGLESLIDNLQPIDTHTQEKK